MKSNYIPVIGLLCLAFTACSKKNEVTDDKPKVKLLTKIAKVTTGGTDSTFTYISYDSKNRISEIRTGNNIKAYNYTGDDLTSVTMKDANGNTTGTVITFTYNNGIIAGAHTPNVNPVIDYTYTYTLSNGRVTRRNGPPQYSHEFTYFGNNLASLKLVGSGTAYYEYGADKSPFYNARYRYCMMLPVESDDIFSENNVVTITYQQTPFLGSRYSYLVGNDGFPKSVNIKATKGMDDSSFIYTSVGYTYEMRDVVN